MPPISVLVVDDHKVFASALRARLAMEPELGPVSVAFNAHDAQARLRSAHVDVAVLDYMLEDSTGAALAERLRTAAPWTRVIVLSAVRSVEPVIEALQAGARAWLWKTVDTDHLVRVIVGVHAGEIWIDPALLGAALPEVLSRASTPKPDPLAVLTERERDVLHCMIEGLSRTEIGDRLNISGNTVRTHTQHLIVKLGVHSSLEAVTLALRDTAHATAPR